MFQAARSISAGLAPVVTAAVVGAAVLAPPAAPRADPVLDAVVGLTAATLPVDPLDPAAVSTQQVAAELADALLTPSAAAGSWIGDGIETIYVYLEKWVQYGVDLLSWAVGWVWPIGFLAPQINIFYDLGESFVRTLLFNTIDVLDGSIGLGQGLSNIGTDISFAFQTFINAQVNWFIHLLPPFPPFPGLPPLPFAADAVAPASSTPLPDPPLGMLDVHGDLFDPATATPDDAAALDAPVLPGDLGDEPGGLLSLIP